MPRTSFTQQFKNPGEVDRFPKYKLEKGEKSRSWLPEEPWMEWYHRIEAPMVESGEIVMEVKDTKKGPVEAMKMDWIGSAFCLGITGTPEDPGPLMLAGIDPDNCPVCESAANSTGVGAPQQRFAANIIKYKVRGRTQNPYELVTPISAEILVWAYTSRIHGTLYELGTEFGDLRKHDIKLELEDTPGADKYQKIKTLSVILEPAYKDAKVRQYVTDLWKDPDNRATDEQLRDACLGRDYARPVLLDMVRRAERQWRDSERGGSGSGDSTQADAAFNGGLSEGIDALLDDHPGGTEEFATQEQRDAIAGAKAQAQRDVAAIVGPDPLDGDDPFAEETPSASGASTTGTAAPAAESPSRTEPKSAESVPGSSEPYDRQDEADWEGRQKAAQQTLNEEAAKARDSAVDQAADDMFGEAGNGSAPPEPAAAKTRKRKAADLPSAYVADPEPAVVSAAGDVIDFDDLFKD